MNSPVECPSCHRKLAGRPKFCTFCRHRLPQKRGMWRKFWLGWGILSVLVMGIALLKTYTDPSNDWDKVGETVKVHDGGGFWPCGSTKSALHSMESGWGIHDVHRVMARTGSVGLDGGMSVLVIDSAYRARKVRVLTDSSGHEFYKDAQGVSSDPRIGRECWVDIAALE